MTTLRTRRIRLAGSEAGLIVGLLLVLVCWPALATEDGRPGSSDDENVSLLLKTHHDFVILRVHDTRLRDVLEAIARKCNLRLKMYGSFDSRITATVETAPLVIALRKLLRHESYLLHLSDGVDSTGVSCGAESGALWVFSAESPAASTQPVLPFDASADTAAAVLAPAPAGGSHQDKIAGIRDPGRPGIPAAVAPLGLALADEDHRVRSAATHALASIGGDDAIAVLAGAMLDEDARVRTEASNALGLIGGDSVIELLRPALEDSDAMVRDAAINAFGEIGGARSAAALGSLLNDDKLVIRTSAVDALGQIGGAAARPYLEQALDDDDELVRKRVLAFLAD